MASEPVPAVVSLHLYGVRGRGIGSALVHMGLDRGRVRRMPGATFVKLLGTGDGTTFTMRDADLGHWGVLACWSDADGPARYEASAAHRSWTGVAFVTPPAIGASPRLPGLYHAVVQNGMTLGPAIGRAGAALVLGRAPEHDLSAFSPARFG